MSEEPSPEAEQAQDLQGDDTGSDDETHSDADSRSFGVGVVTISTDRSLESDTAGGAIVTALKKAGHEVATREHIDAEHDRVQSSVSRLIDRDDVDFVITGGATSIEPDDVTPEAVRPLLDKELSAFSELFTALAYDAVGSRVVASRTIAGVADGMPVFCLPGNGDAARLGLEEIILPEVAYLIGIARAQRDESDHPSSEDEDTDEGEDETGTESDEAAASNADSETTGDPETEPQTEAEPDGE